MHRTAFKMTIHMFCENAGKILQQEAFINQHIALSASMHVSYMTHSLGDIHRSTSSISMNYPKM